jgi:O-antigen ligase
MFDTSMQKSRAGELTLLSSQSQKPAFYDFPFLLLLLFLFFDYGRPQTWLPALGSLHIPMFIQILLFASLVFKNKLFNLKNIQSKLFVGLVALMALHVPLAMNNYYAYQTTRMITLYLVIFLSIVNFVDSFWKIRVFFTIWIVVNATCAVIGTVQGGLVVGSGFLGDENDFALVMNMALPFAYFRFLEAGSSKQKLFYLFAVGLFVAANIASFSRGGFVALVAVIAYCWYKTPRKFAGTISIVMIVGVLSLFAPDKYWGEIRSIKEESVYQGTGASRLYYWKLGGRMFLDHPVIGVGPGNFGIQLPSYVRPDDSYRIYAENPSRGWGKAAHSIYFTLMPELGLLGIFLFLGMLYYTHKDKNWVLNLHETLKASLMKRGDDRIAGQASLAHELHKLKFVIFGINGAMLGYLVAGIFLSVLYYPYFWFLTGISVAIKNVVQDTVEELQLHEVIGK